MATVRKRIGKRGGVSYQVQVRLRQTVITQTFRRLTDAKAWAARQEAATLAGAAGTAGQHYTFGDLLERYEPVARRTLRRFADRLQHLNYWRSRFSAERLSAISSQRIGEERDRLLQRSTGRRDASTGQVRTLSQTTVRCYLAALSAVFSYAVQELKWLPQNPCAGVKKPRPNAGIVRYLLPDERRRLLAACRASRHPDLYLAVLLSLLTGAREGELMSLTWPQVDFEGGLLYLTHTKNKQSRAVPLLGEAALLLKARFDARAEGESRVFPPSARAKKAKWLDLRPYWEQALADAGIENFRWHDLRHTCASYLVMSRVSLVEVAKQLGHKSTQMVMRYAHLAPEHTLETGRILAQKLEI